MIDSEREYRRTKDLIAGLEEATARQSQDVAGVDPLLQQAMHTGQASLLDEWRAEVAWWEARRDPARQPQTFDALIELGATLVQARRARGLSPEALAERAGLDAAQVCVYEAEAYRQAPLAHCQAVAEALDILVRVEALVPFAPGGIPPAAPSQPARQVK